MTVGATEGPIGTQTTAVSNGLSTTVPTATSNDKDMFLQLLVAQMKYQDPMNPTDSSEFLAQSAQFTALEKMQAVADQTQQLVASQMAFGASGLVGRTISWTDAQGATQSGSVTGVTFGTDGPMLDVGDSQVALSQVQTVKAGTAAAASASTSTTTGTTGSPTTTV